MQISRGLPRPRPLALCMLKAQKKSQRRACINSRMQSTTVASPGQTLHELLARYNEKDQPIN